MPTTPHRVVTEVGKRMSMLEQALLPALRGSSQEWEAVLRANRPVLQRVVRYLAAFIESRDEREAALRAIADAEMSEMDEPPRGVVARRARVLLQALRELARATPEDRDRLLRRHGWTLGWLVGMLHDLT